MKSSNITTIILEGTDGVGKSAITDELFKIYNYRYMVYHRGEISNLVYAKKYNRPPAMTQNGAPFLHVLLICLPSELEARIRERGKRLNLSKEEIEKDVNKIADQSLFIETAEALKNDYHIITVNTTFRSVEETGKDVAEAIDRYIAKMSGHDILTQWNEMYAIGCSKCGLDFRSIDNQPYIDNIAFMSESTLQNGVYETFSDKTYPDNLIYSLGYNIPLGLCRQLIKTVDFAYVINSKINRRPEVYDYYKAFDEGGKCCIMSETVNLPEDSKHILMKRQFGSDYLINIAKANATVYVARDLSELKLQTARLYEAILANQIVFVDKYSDIEGEILRNIHHDTQLEYLLTCMPGDIVQKYNTIMSNSELRLTILYNQELYYKNLIENLSWGGKKICVKI